MRQSRRCTWARPAPEGLEDRMLLYAVTGDQWQYPSRVTYSFAPDGTVATSQYNSTLNQAFNADGISTAEWQQQFEAAFGLWEQVAGINIARVPDDGAPIATSGDQQDDPRFGDIRIVGIPLVSGTLGITFLPPPSNGGTLAGDIFINTTEPWQVGGNYDIETVALHEIGHALGMDHSSLMNAVMYAYYNGVKGSLTPDDSAGIQSIYGPVQPDAYNSGGASDHSIGTALNLSQWINSSAWVIAPNINITGSNGSEWFYVAAPSNSSGNVTITFQSYGLSSLSPAFTLYNSTGKYIANSFTQAPFSFGGLASQTFSGATPGTGIYIQVSGTDIQGDQSDGLGALEVNFGTSPLGLVPPPNTVVPQQASQGGGSELELVQQAVASLATDQSGDVSAAQPGLTIEADALTVRALPRRDFRRVEDRKAAVDAHPRGPRYADRGAASKPVPLARVPVETRARSHEARRGE